MPNNPRSESKALSADEIRPLTNQEFEAFRHLIHKRAGISLGDAKQALVNSRLRKRLLFHGMRTFTDYLILLDRLEENDPEFEHLTNCITTNKTDFFREPHHFDFLSQDFLSRAILRWETGQAPKKIRIWHAGCSTGEEPYSAAMVLADGLEGKGVWDVRQLASDIDTRVLAHAERGVYEAAKIEQIPARFRAKYVVPGRGANQGYCQIAAGVRRLITFRHMNLHEPWPIRRDVVFDLIFCRNVMIYFDKATQKKLLDRFATKLAPGGFLLLGHSENTLGLSDRYVPIGRTIYQLPETAQEAA